MRHHLGAGEDVRRGHPLHAAYGRHQESAAPNRGQRAGKSPSGGSHGRGRLGAWSAHLWLPCDSAAVPGLFETADRKGADRNEVPLLAIRACDVPDLAVPARSRPPQRTALRAREYFQSEASLQGQTWGWTAEGVREAGCEQRPIHGPSARACPQARPVQRVAARYRAHGPAFASGPSAVLDRRALDRTLRGGHAALRVA